MARAGPHPVPPPQGHSKRLHSRAGVLVALANHLKHAGLRLAAVLVPRLPRRLAYAAAIPAGFVAAALTPRRRADVSNNLAHVLGPDATPAQLRSLSLAAYQNLVRYYVDLFRSPSVNVDRLWRTGLHENGLSHLTQAVANGHGVILATAHFGSPEIALQAARAKGLTFFVLSEPVEPPQLSELYLHIRAGHGHRFGPVGLSAMKEALRALRQGGIVLLAVDRDIQRSGVVVPFFGAPARMPSGAVELSRLTGAPIIVTVCRRLPDGSSQLTLEPPLALLETGARRADLVENVARLVACLEPYIRGDPDQWIVSERIWDPMLQSAPNPRPRQSHIGGTFG